MRTNSFWIKMSKFLPLLLLSCTLVQISAQTTTPTPEMKGSVQSAVGWSLEWQSLSRETDQYLSFVLQATTKGYMAVAFGHTLYMAHSDGAIFFPSPDGSTFLFADLWIPERAVPILDSSIPGGQSDLEEV